MGLRERWQPKWVSTVLNHKSVALLVHTESKGPYPRIKKSTLARRLVNAKDFWRYGKETRRSRHTLMRKVLSRKLYMTKITAPQMRTAACCVLGSAIRGTFKAREMVANDRIPSIQVSLDLLQVRWMTLTHCSNNLRFESILIGEPASKVANTALAITCNIRHLSNMVEHMTAGEKKNGNQTDCRPDVSVLDDR